MTIPAVHAWRTNGHLIEAVARLHLRAEWHTLDPTYGRGAWWTRWRPDHLVTSDLDLAGGASLSADFRRLPFPAASFDAVAFDPPYKLNGTPALGDFDARYGLTQPRTWQERHALIRDGITEAVRVLRPRGVLLVKCQDQVCSGRVRWQTNEFANYATTLGCTQVDRFDMSRRGRPQPPGRRQVHARERPSTLLVLRTT